MEEPNIWNTWNKIYLEVKPMLDNLVDEDAMSEYTWMGDQDANSYNDLSVNNEADVRQGKYKAILKFKDIVPMQEITMGIYIDQASKSVSIQDVNE
nr:MAG: Type VI secretion system, TssC, VipB [Bacteriophage sp.]